MSQAVPSWLHVLFLGRDKVAEAAQAEEKYQAALMKARACMRDPDELRAQLRDMVEDVEKKAREVPSVPPSKPPPSPPVTDGVVAVVELREKKDAGK